MRSPQIPALMLLALALTACTPTVANRGAQIDPEKLATLKAGVSNRDTVISALGTPSLRGSFDDNVWYYVGRRTEQYAFFDPEVTEQQIVTIHFDDSGTIKTLETADKEAITAVDAASGETPTFGHETTWIQDLFGNIGRAGASTGKQQR